MLKSIFVFVMLNTASLFAMEKATISDSNASQVEAIAKAETTIKSNTVHPYFRIAIRSRRMIEMPTYNRFEATGSKDCFLLDPPTIALLEIVDTPEYTEAAKKRAIRAFQDYYKQ